MLRPSEYVGLDLLRSAYVARWTHPACPAVIRFYRSGLVEVYNRGEWALLEGARYPAVIGPMDLDEADDLAKVMGFLRDRPI